MLEVLQIIWEVLFPEPDPNVVQFIEPITLALMGGAALAKGIGSAIKGRQARRALEEQSELDRAAAEAAKAEADTQIADALAKQAEYGLAPTYNELRKTVMEDPMADLQRQEALRSEAEQVQALKTGGARALLGGLERVDETTADRFAKIAAEESQRRKAGLQTIGAAEAQVEGAKFQQAGQDLASARALREGALGAESAADALRVRGELAGKQGVTEGITGALSTGLGMAAQMSGDGGGGDGGYLEPSITSVPQNVTTVGGGGGLLDFLNQTNVGGWQASGGSSGENGMEIPRFGEGGMTFEEGAALMRGETPGEFSHDRNPIDIMQDGAKIGEMTGGEGIVSPEDMGKMEQLAGKGDTPLHKFVRSWFKKISKNNV